MKITTLTLILLTGSLFSHAQSPASLIAAAEENRIKNHWERATSQFKSILENYEDNLTYLQRANIYNSLGFLSLQLLEPFESERYLNNALLYHEEAGIPDQKDYADALLNMGMLYLNQVEFDLAKRNIQRALDIYDQLPGSKTDYWIARSKLALLYEEAGSYTLALSIYNESFDQLVASNNDLSPDFAEICMHKGRILIFTGEPLEGEKFINLSSTIYESLGPQYAVQRAESLEHLAVFYEKLGRNAEAEQILLQVLQLKRSIPDEADILIIETLNDLGILYQDMGRYQRAKQMFYEVVLECEENVGTDHPFYATAKNNLGTLAIAEGDYRAAKGLFQSAMATYKVRFGDNHPYYANALNNLARVERKLGNLGVAEEYYKEVLRIDERIYGKNDPGYATTLINLGILCSADGREEDAVKYYKEALEIRERVLGVNHPGYGSALEYMGIHSLAIDDLTAAETYFKQSIEIQISQIKTLFPIMNDQSRFGYYTDIRSKVDRYNYIAFKLLPKQPELTQSIFDFQVKTKSLLFNTTHQVKKAVAESEDLDLKSYYEQWKSDKQLLAAYYQMNVQELNQLNINLVYEEERIERLEKRISQKLESFENSLPNVNGSWKTAQKTVHSGEPIVEFIRIHEFESLTETENTLYGFTDRVQYLAIIFKHGESEPSYAILGDDFKTDNEHFEVFKRISEGAVAATDAYKYLWQPVHDKIKGATNVRVVPDGIYNKININTLRPDQGSYVIDDYFVSFLSSTKDLLRSTYSVFHEKALLFSNPTFHDASTEHSWHLPDLEDTEEAIQDIESELSLEGWGVRTYAKDEAREYMIRSAYHPTMLYIATHGFFTDLDNYLTIHTPINTPQLKSGLLLADAAQTLSRFKQGIPSIESNDGILTSYEIMNMDLNRTEFVVLPFTQVNQENAENEEGIFGLQRAFMIAGARNLLFTLNKPEPASVSLVMKNFLSKYRETGAVRDAFKFAIEKLRQEDRNPATWGSFVLTGNE